MSEKNAVAQSLHDLGLAAWFGGSLYGASSTNASTKELRDPVDRLRASNAAWNRWAPINLAFIAAHLVGGAQLVGSNRRRLKGQAGFLRASNAKFGMTVAALGASGYARVLGKKLNEYERSQTSGAGMGGPAAQDVTTPAPETPPDVAKAQKQLKLLQYAIPTLTGGMLVVNAYLSQSLRPLSTLKGLMGRVRS